MGLRRGGGEASLREGEGHQRDVHGARRNRVTDVEVERPSDELAPTVDQATGRARDAVVDAVGRDEMAPLTAARGARVGGGRRALVAPRALAVHAAAVPALGDAVVPARSAVRG